MVEINMGDSLRGFFKKSSNPIIISMCDDTNNGGLLPSVIPIFLWTKKILKEYEPGSIFFLDGGVRKPKEAELFLGLLNEINDIKIKVIHLKIAKKESKKRLMERARSDDKPEIIEKRFKEHRRIIKKTLKI